MTPYSRGYAAGQEEMRRRAAETCKTFAKTGRDIAADPVERSQLRNSAALQALAADTCADYILSLPIEGETDQRGADADAVPLCKRESGVNGIAQSVPHPNPGEQELPTAAAKALPYESRVSTSDRDATEGTSAQQPASPGPCVVVPVEPTEKMLDAACRVLDPSGDTKWPSIRDAASRYYKAMLAAAKEEHDAHR